MKKNFINLCLALFLGFSASIAANAADYNLRFTAPSNENDEDYDGAIVLKSYIEAASNGAIEVEVFIGTQLCAKGADVFKELQTVLSIFMLALLGELQEYFLTSKSSTYPT